MRNPILVVSTITSGASESARICDQDVRLFGVVTICSANPRSHHLLRRSHCLLAPVNAAVRAAVPSNESGSAMAIADPVKNVHSMFQRDTEEWFT